MFAAATDACQPFRRIFGSLTRSIPPVRLMHKQFFFLPKTMHASTAKVLQANTCVLIFKASQPASQPANAAQKKKIELMSRTHKKLQCSSWCGLEARARFIMCCKKPEMVKREKCCRGRQAMQKKGWNSLTLAAHLDAMQMPNINEMGCNNVNCKLRVRNK